MKKGKILSLLAISGAASMLLTGCLDSMPELTENEETIISQYAAGLLLKYSPNYDYRLVSSRELLDALTQEQLDKEQLTQEQTGETESEEQNEQADASSEVSSETGEEASEDSMSEPLSNDGTEISDITDTDNTDGMEKLRPADTDIAEMLGMDGVSIKYENFELCDKYPKDAGGFSLAASKDKKLLVIHMKLENASQESKGCDFIQYEITGRLQINDGQRSKILNTMLGNDITSYMERVEGGENADIVAISEIGAIDDDDIASLSMTLESNGGECSLKLR